MDSVKTQSAKRSATTDTELIENLMAQMFKSFKDELRKGIREDFEKILDVKPCDIKEKKPERVTDSLCKNKNEEAACVREHTTSQAKTKNNNKTESPTEKTVNIVPRPQKAEPESICTGQDHETSAINNPESLLEEEIIIINEETETLTIDNQVNGEEQIIIRKDPLLNIRNIVEVTAFEEVEHIEENILENKEEINASNKNEFHELSEDERPPGVDLESDVEKEDMAAEKESLPEKEAQPKEKESSPEKKKENEENKDEIVIDEDDDRKEEEEKNEDQENQEENFSIPKKVNLLEEQPTVTSAINSSATSVNEELKEKKAHIVHKAQRIEALRNLQKNFLIINKGLLSGKRLMIIVTNLFILGKNVKNKYLGLYKNKFKIQAENPGKSKKKIKLKCGHGPRQTTMPFSKTLEPISVVEPKSYLRGKVRKRHFF